MPQFHFKALSSDGRVLRGRLEAGSREDAIAELQRRQHFPISARPSVTSSFAFLKGRTRRHANDKVLANFFHSLVSLLEAGLPLARGLDLLAKLEEFRSLQHSIASVAAAVRRGDTLADALQREAAFSSFMIAMIRAGEIGGTLGPTIALLAKYLERASATRQAITSALLYPVFLLVTAAVSIAVIMIIVVPAFAPLFEGAQKALPLGAAVLLATSDFLSSYWETILITGGLLWIAGASLRTKPAFKRWLDDQILRTPFLGKLVAQVEAERCCRILAALLSNGVPLPTALEFTKDVLGRYPFQRVVAEAAVKVREGRVLSEHLQASALFPEGVVDFVRVGEESGSIANALARQADLLADRIKSSINRGLAIVVPAITIGLGVLVGGIVATLLTAILSINELAL